jgi:hypothetical protein
VDFLLLFFDDGLDAFINDKNIGIVFFDYLADRGVLIESLSGGREFVLGVVEDFFEFVRENGGALFKSEGFFDVNEMSF